MSVAYMPRKNVKDSEIVKSFISRDPSFKHWEFTPISSMSHSSVLSVLKSSMMFLSFGHPEGFGLPVAEALCCGCSICGYTGLGGRELFKLAEHLKIGHSVEFGDWNVFSWFSILDQPNDS